MFKKGSLYTREQIARMVRPENPPRGGDWTTGYARIDSNLYVFMNIGVPGRTGHNFENHYDAKSRTLIWFSKPGKKSSNPLFQKLLSGQLTPYFFARWDSKNTQFTFLGTGSVVNFQDGYTTPQGYQCIRFVVNVNDLHEVIAPRNEGVEETALKKEDGEKSSFLFEKQLEDFLIANWSLTPLARNYDIFEKDGEVVGRQFRTDTGPIDILGQRRDKSDFLVVELKRDRASDVVVGQTLRYMGWVKEHLCEKHQSVKGCIVAQRKDAKLDYALKQADSIQFMRYEIDFRLTI